jgi:glycerol-3-phosphate acyltransferase PlsX
LSALLHIAIDAMSGDRGPSVCVPAAVAAAREFGDVRFTLIGRQPDLERELGSTFPANVSCLFAADVVEMTDHPREALRRKKDSSMRRAIDLVKTNVAHACVSAGNTGALMATAHFVLKMLPGVERPAIVSLIPSRGGHTYMLDLGANASCTPVQLAQFAVMGSVLAADLEGAHPRPRVGLLNIGTEDIKPPASAVPAPSTATAPMSTVNWPSGSTLTVRVPALVPIASSGPAARPCSSR